MVTPMFFVRAPFPYAPLAPRGAPVAALAGGCLLAGMLIGLLLASPARPGSSGARELAQEPATRASPRFLPGPVAVTPLRVVDGDTFEARAPVWFGQEITVLVRLRGFDAPETNGRCAREIALARDASATLREVLGAGRVILTDLTPDKYNGRVVAAVWVENGKGQRDAVGDMLVAGGYARPYDGRGRAPWCR